MFLTVLAPVPIIFVAIFLYRAPLGELNSSAKTLSIAPPKHPVPVVLIIFDEFAEPTLMGPNHLIDAGRFPELRRSSPRPRPGTETRTRCTSTRRTRCRRS